MRPLAILLLMAILLAHPTGVRAEDRSYFTLGMGKSFVHKPEIFKRVASYGYNAFAGVGFDFTSFLSGHVVGEYHWRSIERYGFGWGGETVKAKCAFFLLKFSPYSFESRFAPYIIGGGGYVYVDRRTSAGATTYGLGIDVWLTPRIGVSVEGRHADVHFDEGRFEGRPLKIGVTYLLRGVKYEGDEDR